MILTSLGGKLPVVCSWALGLTTFYPSGAWAADLFLHTLTGIPTSPIYKTSVATGSRPEWRAGLFTCCLRSGELLRSFS